MEQKETLHKLINCFDSDFARFGKVSLATGIEVKKLMALEKNDKPLSEKDYEKLTSALKLFKK